MITATITIDLDLIAKEGIRFDAALEDELRRIRTEMTRDYERDQLVRSPDFRVLGYTVEELNGAMNFARLKGWDASQSR